MNWGVDMLDPIQGMAKGMDIQFLSEKFGGKIVFHGGFNMQQVLPFGTFEDVIAHTKSVI
jgi:uroporphyrinogen decarboxylase